MCAKSYLSPLGMAAAGLWYRWHNDMTVGLLAGSPGHRSPGSIEEIQQTIDGYLKASDRAHVFVIADLATDRPIGWCALFVADAANRRATLSTLIGEKDYWGRGYVQDALRVLLTYGFQLLNVNSVELIVHEENARARRCCEKLGFRVTGRERQARLVGAQRLDNLTMDLLAEEVTPVPLTSEPPSPA